MLYIKAVETLSPDDALGVGVIELLHWLRFREPYVVSLREYQEGSLKAAKEVYRTWWDFEQRPLGGKYPRGFKISYDHNYIFTSWGLGLENLNQEELAECLGEFCPRAKGEHTAMLFGFDVVHVQSLEEIEASRVGANLNIPNDCAPSVVVALLGS